MIRSGLLLCGAGLLLFWLSGGFPPDTWLLLISVLAQFNTLWGQQGNVLLWPYVLLIAQSLSLAIAWVLFVWALIHETRYILNLRDQRQHRVSPAVVARSTSSPTVEEPLQTATKEAESSAESRRLRRAERLPVPVGEMGLQKKKFPENPYEGVETKPEQHREEAGDQNSPFDVKNDVYSVFRHHDAKASGGEEDEEGKTKKATKGEKEEEENPFRFGNPFEGPLPEVFNYDVDLRRSILEIEAEVKHLEIAPPQKDQPEKKADDKETPA